MPNSIDTYLNDHLGGSAAALDLLATVRRHAHNAEFERVIDSVTKDIEEDREELVRVMGALNVDQGTLKQAGAKIAEKAMRVKSSSVITRDDHFSRLLELEALCIGISGKKAAWLALRATERDALENIEFDRLIARADDQRARLEPLRLEAATEAFAE